MHPGPWQEPTRRLSPRRLILILVALAGMLVVGCSSGEEVKEVRGIVRDVQAASITEVRSLTVEDDAGKLWEFTAREQFADYTPSHLREHAAVGAPLTVRFVEENGELVIVEITD